MFHYRFQKGKYHKCAEPSLTPQTVFVQWSTRAAAAHWAGCGGSAGAPLELISPEEFCLDISTPFWGSGHSIWTKTMLIELLYFCFSLQLTCGTTMSTGKPTRSSWRTSRCCGVWLPGSPAAQRWSEPFARWGHPRVLVFNSVLDPQVHSLPVWATGYVLFAILTD